MLSNACKYAIRSVLYLALHTNQENKKIGAKLIAENLEVPQPFLAKLLQQLSKNNLVSSSKGPTGGFYMSEDNLQNTIWDVVVSIDGTDKFTHCFMGLKSCDDKNPCPIHFKVAPFKRKILEDFKEKTIIEFSKKIKENGRYISLKEIEV